MSRALAIAVLAWICLASGVAGAHAFRPAVLTVRALEPGRFAYRYQPPLDDRRAPIPGVRPRFAEHCTATESIVDCGGRGLQRIAFEGLQLHPVDVIVRVVLADATEHHTVLRGDRNVVELGDRMAGASSLAVAGAYTALGLEHIAEGTDHILFVLGLAALVGLRRRLLWTITGFTVAHSITLALSALAGWSLPSRPVEIGIALSIVLLAVEIVDDRPSLSRRAPSAVAFAFGLLHGMGFAGALAEIGLPPAHATLALLGFNVGVELGQIMIVTAAACVAWGWRRSGLPSRAALVVCAYLGGSIAAAWTLQRWFS